MLARGKWIPFLFLILLGLGHHIGRNLDLFLRRYFIQAVQLAKTAHPHARCFAECIARWNALLFGKCAGLPEGPTLFRSLYHSATGSAEFSSLPSSPVHRCAFYPTRSGSSCVSQLLPFCDMNSSPRTPDTDSENEKACVCRGNCQC